VAWEAPAGVEAGSSYEVVALPTMTVHTTNANKLEICGLEVGAKYSFEIRTVVGGTKSDPVKTNEVTIGKANPSAWWLISSYLLVALLLAAVVVAILSISTERDRDGVAFACGVLTVGLLLLTVTGRSYGLWRAVIGADGRVSTSRVTTGLWTLLVAFALAYLTARSWFQNESGLFEGLFPGSSTNSKASEIWEEYLVLLGGPFAALVFARGIISSKVQNQTVQKTLADDGTATLKQALTNDSGDVDLVDSQYLVFNVVALGYVIVGFASTGQLPAIPGILLALTGSSAATYVLNKAVTNEQPTITGVIPSSFRPGQRIVITGTNLLPAGPDKPPLVSIAGKQALVDAHATNAQITVVVPPGVPVGGQELIVITAARATSEGRPVVVLADQPEILSIDPAIPTVGQQMVIRGLGFSSELDPTTTCSVKIGATPIDAVPTRFASGMEELTVIVPADQPVPGPADVIVKTPRGTSSPAVTVNFKAA
jgi:hypothetical protein